MSAENKEPLPFISSMMRALRRARLPILTVGLTYFLSVAAGMLMVQAANRLAIATRANSSPRPSPARPSGHSTRATASRQPCWISAATSWEPCQTPSAG